MTAFPARAAKSRRHDFFVTARGLLRCSLREAGNLSRRGIGEIWNDPAFRDFRAGVIDYDHSPCTDCSVAPCDYVQTDHFEQDCHIKNQPCGSCLWCTGLFQCLS